MSIFYKTSNTGENILKNLKYIFSCVTRFSKIENICSEDDFSAGILYIFPSIIILLFREFFPLTLAEGFSLEFERQQVSLSLQDSSQYSQQCSSLDVLYSSSYFQVLQFL